ncbi:TetR/AcrR family transcriptional regulator C-terminal domain-containing protein [Microbispora sp. RL4-1S]|uniref:TetR/AcrR family transcriptional regulator C-terminal domain-containing protein n=1 Tax=Microbispora oryzae TaxID=2806554 RepID=A0A940WLD2_9ACTN|nr:TetR/AcrR family transcriptional regulator C-terminal domain-containing protein [Microbispora oryzae]MBP2707765.1 TetR/AcrR family transcriptional regulator C-terminal domain-containing protein [Microbispora oryzae]
MALERDRIVGTALRLLDEVGLDKLTLRRLAAELGVQAPALYWHFRSKQELLDEMTEVISVGQSPPLRPLAEGESWESWLGDWIRGRREVLNSHRDAARLIAGTHPGRATLEAVELILESLQRAGFTGVDAMWGLGTLASFLGGFVHEEQADRERGLSDQSQFDKAMEDLAPYPHLRAVMAETGGPQSDASFEHGLSLIIAGMRARLASGPADPADSAGAIGSVGFVGREGDGDLSVEGVQPTSG